MHLIEILTKLETVQDLTQNWFKWWSKVLERPKYCFAGPKSITFCLKNQNKLKEKEQL